MLGSWLIYLIPGLLGTGVLSLVATRRGRAILKRGRDKLRRKAVRDTKGAWSAHRKVVASTPRGKLRARRRAQPKRLTFGYRRTADDPTVARKLARKTKAGAGTLWERAKVARANRKASRAPKAKPVLALLAGSSPIAPNSHECGATIERSRGRTATCSRVVATPGERCWQHGGRRAA